MSRRRVDLSMGDRVAVRGASGRRPVSRVRTREVSVVSRRPCAHPVRTYLWPLVLGMLTATVAYGVLSSRFFRVQQVVVSGQARVSEDALRRLAGIPVGASVFRTREADVRRRLGAHPWIKSVALSFGWSGKVHLRVTEYQPVAVVSMDQPYFVARTGRVVAPLGSEGSGALPLVSGVQALDADGTAVPAIDPLQWAVAERFIDFAAAALPDQVAEIHVDAAGQVEVMLQGGGPWLRLGSEPWAGAIRRWQGLDRVVEDRVAVAHVVDRGQAGRARAVVRAVGSNRSRPEEK